jgi:hypothetical protein
MRNVPSIPVRVGMTRHAARRSPMTCRILVFTHHLLVAADQPMTRRGE